jgi:hypothetical protein
MFGGLLIILIGVIFLAKALGFTAFVSWDIIWPSIIILLGVSALFKKGHCVGCSMGWCRGGHRGGCNCNCGNCKNCEVQ